VSQAAQRVLDCCAAPGGKTLILAERNPQAKVTAWEISPARCESLRERMAASRFATRIDVVLADATKQLAEGDRYDLVLADVPCSGTGTMGRNPEIRHRLRLEDLTRHHDRQVAILLAALSVGTRRVIYSTCSLEPEENQAVVAEVLAQATDWRQISVMNALHQLRDGGRLTPEGEQMLSNGLADDGSLTILPGSLGASIQTDGFFVAVLEKSL
jgi:16S rRNA (cytosine967-C5)-methyltransferase